MNYDALRVCGGGGGLPWRHINTSSTTEVICLHIHVEFIILFVILGDTGAACWVLFHRRPDEATIKHITLFFYFLTVRI